MQFLNNRAKFFIPKFLDTHLRDPAAILIFKKIILVFSKEIRKLMILRLQYQAVHSSGGNWESSTADGRQFEVWYNKMSV